MAKTWEQYTVGTNCPTGAFNVYGASSMTRGPQRFKKWYECGVCGLDFPEDQVTVFQGKVFGIPCGCYKDIEQLRRS